jgi:hypothetical protein
VSQIEVAKVVQHTLIGPPDDNISVAKVVMYVWAEPGDSGSDLPARQAHVYSQKIRRD